MSAIVLSAAVRQNLLSLQSTASLLATTQNDLATGNKVNSALDSPTNYFTAQNLNARASDIGNLLDSIGNGVQVLQAANTGITSLQSLVSNAKSVANQVLQTPVGYSTKASIVSTAITSGGTAVTASDLRGAGTVSATAVTGTAVTTSGGLSSSTPLTALIPALTTSDTVTFQNSGKSVTFTTSGSNQLAPNQNAVLNISTSTVGDLVTALGDASGSGSELWSLNASGALVADNTGSADVVTGAAGTLIKLGLAVSGTTEPINTGTNTFTPMLASGSSAITAGSTLSWLSTALTTSDTLTVNGKSIAFNSGAGTSISASGASIDLSTATVQSILNAVDTLSGAGTGASSVNGSGDIVLSTGTASDLTLGGTALAKLGLTAGTTQRTGLTLSFGAVGGGTATTVTFGNGTGGTVKSLNDLNSALAADNLIATLETSGKLTVTTSNDNASSSLSATGTATTAATGAFKTSNGATITATPVADATSQATRASLVAQYNNILQQINSTAQDSSFNGVNLLNGDTLKLVFDETGKSTLSIQGVTFNDTGLALSTLAAGTDFLDSNSADKTLSALNSASATLGSEASTLGSNLSVVQIRQDFNKNLIDVLQSGASNLTLADTNQLAADSQALSTRQSIAVSALALANQSQQAVLQLLR